MMNDLATILIVARNAATTIRRAVGSALVQGDYPILLVDDVSEDDTVRRARDMAGDQLQVYHQAGHSTLGAARQTALCSVTTPYAVWLDADDELLPGRVTAMVDLLRKGCHDLVTDETELVDGATGRSVEILRIPGFVRRHPAARLFERNYLPGVGVVGLRTDFAKGVGYDVTLHGAEDMDFLLRAVARGARLGWLDRVGYRLYAYPDSLSRQLSHQRWMYRECLRKHSYEDVRTLYEQAAYNKKVTVWGLISMALFREDFTTALQYLGEVQSLTRDAAEVLEPDGPCPRPEGWRIDFHRGTVWALLRQYSKAEMALENAEGICPTPEGSNNLGVVKAKTGKTGDSRRLFLRSLEIYPDYYDAAANLKSGIPDHITTHPLRVVRNRDDYRLTAESPPAPATGQVPRIANVGWPL